MLSWGLRESFWSRVTRPSHNLREDWFREKWLIWSFWIKISWNSYLYHPKNTHICQIWVSWFISRIRSVTSSPSTSSYHIIGVWNPDDHDELWIPVITVTYTDYTLLKTHSSKWCNDWLPPPHHLMLWSLTTSWGKIRVVDTIHFHGISSLWSACLVPSSKFIHNIYKTHDSNPCPESHHQHDSRIRSWWWLRLITMICVLLMIISFFHSCFLLWIAM